MPRTYRTVIVPTAVIIGAFDEHAALFKEVVVAKGLRLEHESNVALACARIPRTMPQIVIASASLAESDLATIEDRAVAVGAVFAVIGEDMDASAVRRQLEAVVSRAREEFGRRT
jgi:hypothetical protein